jgi:hypothetical protein
LLFFAVFASLKHMSVSILLVRFLLEVFQQTVRACFEIREK